MRVEIITTGSELMLGYTVNSHPAFLAQQLATIGLRVDRQIAVADHRAEMRAAIAESLGRSDLVIVTGGLGPTSDDFTREVVSQYLGRKLVRDEMVAAAITARFRRRGLPVIEAVYTQALVPEGARVLTNHNGTAPGLALEHAGKLVFLLPGPPRELKPMFAEQVLPLIEERFGRQLPLDCRVLRVVGMTESAVAEQVEAALKGVTGLELGYCARLGEVEVRLVGADRPRVDAAEQQVRATLGDRIYGSGDDRLEEVLVKMLTAARRTLAVAESCTGGRIADRVTNVSGASEVFLQGWVTYSNEAKTRELGVREATLREHGAVSEAVAREMAEGARLRSGADYAVSATGIAGPTGGTPEKPVGLVYLGLATPGDTRVQRHVLTFDRETFKFFAAQLALGSVRTALLRELDR